MSWGLRGLQHGARVLPAGVQEMDTACQLIHTHTHATICYCDLHDNRWAQRVTTAASGGLFAEPHCAFDHQHMFVRPAPQCSSPDGCRRLVRS